MTRIDYEIEYPLLYIKLSYLEKKRWFLEEDMEITMSDKRVILIPKGFETDLSSIPSWLWGLFKPFDEGLLGDIIHDYLWQEKMAETLYFNNAYVAQKFADDERLKWRKKLAKEFPIKNWITHKALRIFGGKYYRGEKKIPK